jgi:putative glutamine amidotransferase
MAGRTRPAEDHFAGDMTRSRHSNPYTVRVSIPIIAVSAYRLAVGRVSGWNRGAIAAPDVYVEAIIRAGGMPALLPSRNGTSVEDVLDRFDGLLLIGGGDVQPERYGADSAHPNVYGVDPARDEFEIRLTRKAADAEMPMMAVCRGIQLVNVAFGGTLHQHLADVAGLDDHGRPTEEEPWVDHELKVAESSRLAEATGQATLMGRASHHQAIDRVGEGLAPVAWTHDGVVEAVEADRGWVVGVQWHPEQTAAEDPAQQALFDALVAKAAARR